MDEQDDTPEPDRGKILDDPRLSRGDMRLVAAAIKNGRIKERWGTNRTAEELAEVIASGNATLKDRIEFAIYRAAGSESERNTIAAARVGVAMERQNQLDQHVAIVANLDQTPQRIDKSPEDIVRSMMATIPYVPEAKAE